MQIQSFFLHLNPPPSPLNMIQSHPLPDTVQPPPYQGLSLLKIEHEFSIENLNAGVHNFLFVELDFESDGGPRSFYLPSTSFTLKSKSDKN